MRNALIISIALAAAAGAGPAAAQCADGADLRKAAKAESDLFIDASRSVDQRFESRERAWAYAVLVWDSYGRENITGDYEISVLVGQCYQKGECGLAKDAALGAQLTQQHVSRYKTGQAAPQADGLSQRPPQEAVSWARETLGGACATATTQLASGASKEVVQPTPPANATRESAVISRTVTLSPRQQMENQLNYAIATLIREGNVAELLEPPLAGVVTMEQAAKALENRMTYFQTPPRRSQYYGVDTNLSSFFLEDVRPYVSEEHRKQINEVLVYVRRKEASRAKQYAYQDAVDQTKAGLSKALQNYLGQSAGSAQSGRSFIDQQNWEDYIRGRANRQPCSVARPCGPGNQFERVK